MRVRRCVMVAAVALVVLGCTPGGDGPTDGASPGAAGGGGSAEARWTRVELPGEALLSESRVSFDGGVLAGSDGLPHMVSGVAAEPGAPDRVRVWTSDDMSEWDAADVSVGGGADASVAASATNGQVTVVVGSTWTVDAGVRPFVLRSDDRREWDEVTVPEEAVERAVDPQEAALGGDALLVVGVDRDNKPVAVRVGGDGGELVELPVPDDDVNFAGFIGVAVAGDVVVALADLGERGGSTSPVTYRSADGGTSWESGEGPAIAGGGISGVVHTDDGFVATGWVEDDGGSKDPAAWLSLDGRQWEAEDVPNTGSWLGAPAARGTRVVAGKRGSPEVGGILVRDGSGSWSARGPARGEGEDWIGSDGGDAVAPLGDGAVLLARWTRNSGTVGVVADGEWTSSLDIGPNDPGLQWSQLDLEGETPILVGFNTTVTVERSAENKLTWLTTPEYNRWSLTDDAIAASAWDPPETGDLPVVRVASDDAGGTVVLGEDFVARPGAEELADPEREADELDVVGWFRAAPDAAWTPAEGLSGPRTESLDEVFWLGDQWIAVGWDQDSVDTSAHFYAAVWTSDDGVQWRREEGPFEVARERDSEAAGACRLPGDGGVLAVGLAEAQNGNNIPMAWRQTGGEWTRVGGSALGDGSGEISSCALRDDVTVLQGSFEGRDVLWRTTDGETFERSPLGERGESFAPVRSVASGFAAAGTRGAAGGGGAVVWLSGDGEDWWAVAAPSDRRLEGADVLDWDGRLLVAATAARDQDDHVAGDPEVWVLENPAEVLAAASGAS